MAAHALLGASKAEQWLNCPPSARLQEKVPNASSTYTEEGTHAHAVAENRLRRHLTLCDSAERKRLDAELKKLQKSPYYNKEMENAVQEYVDYVSERFLEAKKRSSDAVILLEENLDFSEWVPEGFGTGDAVIISDSILEVIDFKYGKGVPVSAEGNPQLRLYGLGAWAAHSWLYDIETVIMTIHQPRLDSISTDTLPVDELIAWGETVVRPAAALAHEGKGEFRCGDHCRWCRVKGNCRARADENLKALEYEFQEPELLTNEEIGSILFIAQKLQEWAKDIENYAFQAALNGETIPFWKLVEGMSRRVFTDPEKIKEVLKDAGYEESQYIKQDLKGVGDLEKLVGKRQFTNLVGDLVIKPPGAPTLVPETDRRPPLNDVHSDFENMEWEEIA